MNPLEEASIDCPHCGEYFTIVVDASLGDQDYIEDCYVCCSPIRILIHFESVAVDDEADGFESEGFESEGFESEGLGDHQDLVDQFRIRTEPAQ